MCLELQAAAQVGRTGGLPSSRLMMDTLLGTDMDIGFDDYLKSEKTFRWWNNFCAERVEDYALCLVPRAGRTSISGTPCVSSQLSHLSRCPTYRGTTFRGSGDHFNLISGAGILSVKRRWKRRPKCLLRTSFETRFISNSRHPQSK